ncbi:hypothetical protein ABVT39_014052 [Epinephelus coioides]
MPQCLQAVQAAALAIQSSATIVLFHPLTLKVSHTVDALLTQTKIAFMSPARHLNCTTILLSQPHLTAERCTTLNPATLLLNETDGTKHDCAAIATQKWKNRGMITSTGKSILHTDLILALLEAILLPLQIAVCKCAAHTSGNDPISQGNWKADEEVKAAAARQDYQDIYTAEQITHIDHDILKDMQQNLPDSEKQFWANKRVTLSENELWK